VARWDESVQHFGGAGVRMDQTARLYLCARCRVQVVLCSHCDRGNRYCNRACLAGVNYLGRSAKVIVVNHLLASGP
jgi:hypothetical protein